MMTATEYARWISIARRFSSRPDEAADLLHDGLLVAIGTGRDDLKSEDNRKWLTGVLRNQAALRARSAVRRKTRETRAHESAPINSTSRSEPTDDPPSLDNLPPALKSLATLVLAGLGRDEIRHVLQLTDVALRKRISKLSGAVAGVSASSLPAAARGDLGLMRQTLLGVLRRRKPVHAVGFADPDGHLIVVAKK
jgi:DNA-directed RNA polymerase specialized sigma24 family protein